MVELRLSVPDLFCKFAVTFFLTDRTTLAHVQIELGSWYRWVLRRAPQGVYKGVQQLQNGIILHLRGSMFNSVRVKKSINISGCRRGHAGVFVIFFHSSVTHWLVWRRLITTGQCHAFTAGRWRLEIQKHWGSTFTDPVVGVGLCHVHQLVVYECMHHLYEYVLDTEGDNRK